MKKLMIIAAVVCAAIATNAASMKWSQTTKIYTPDPTKDGKWTSTSLGANGKAYLFELTKAQYDALFVSGDYATSAANVFNEFATVSDAGKISITGATDSKASKLGKIEAFTDSKTFGVGDVAYAAMIVTTTGSDGKDYYIANIGSYSFAADAAGELANMAGKEFGTASGAAITGWTVVEGVPEPTSGLLLLLGVAGLALRRRRA